MVVGDDELDAGETTSAHALQERGPERAVFAVADIEAQHFRVSGGGDPGGDHDRPRHHAAADAALHIGGVQEHVHEAGVVQRPLPERFEVAVELAADP